MAGLGNGSGFYQLPSDFKDHPRTPSLGKSVLVPRQGKHEASDLSREGSRLSHSIRPVLEAAFRRRHGHNRSQVEDASVW